MTQGLQAGTERRQRQQQIELEKQSGQRAQQQLEQQQSEFKLKQPILSEEGRKAMNQKALDTAFQSYKPEGFFNELPPEKKQSFYNALQQSGYNGGLQDALQAHDTVAGQTYAPTGPQMMRSFMNGGQGPEPRGAGNESENTGGSPGSLPPPRLTMGQSGPSPVAAPNARAGQVSAPTLPRPFLGPGLGGLNMPSEVTGATGNAGVPPAGVGDVGGTGGSGAPGAAGQSPKLKLSTPIQQPKMGFRMVPKMNEKGQPGIQFEQRFPGLTPELQDQLIKDPMSAQSLEDQVRPAAEKFVAQHQAATKDLRDRVKGDEDIAGYIGASGHGGARNSTAKMDAVLSKLTNPKTGQVDWSNVNAPTAFSLIFADANSNNPGAIVRPSDVENLTELQGHPQKWANIWHSFVTGNKLTPQLMAGLRDLVHERTDAAKGAAISAFDNIAGEAGANRVPLERIADRQFLADYQASKKAGLPSVTGVKAQAPQISASSMPTVSTAEEFNALPKGAKFRSSDGRVGTKL